MTIKPDLDAWWVVLTDYNEANAAKARFQDLMWQFEGALDELETMNGTGDFDQLPASVKAKMVWAGQQFAAARNTVKADSDVIDIIQWTP